MLVHQQKEMGAGLSGVSYEPGTVTLQEILSTPATRDGEKGNLWCLL